MTSTGKKEFVDGYGEQLWSYFQTGEPKNEIVERDDGFMAFGRFDDGQYLMVLGKV